MAQVTVTVNGRDYPVACQDGEEARIVELAARIDGYASELARSIGQMGQSHLILMVALLLADELEDTRAGERTSEQSEAAAYINTLGRRLAGIAEKLEST